MSAYDEVVEANERYVASFGSKGDWPPSGPTFCDPHLHGRPARPGEVRRAQRG